MVIGFDIDDTITRHPPFFAVVTHALRAAGHRWGWKGRVCAAAAVELGRGGVRMPTCSTTMELAATPEAVWALWEDVAGWPGWTPTVTSATPVDGSVGLRVGAKWRLVQPKLPETVWTVEESEPGRAFAWTSASPGVRVRAEHTIEPVAGGVRVTLTVRMGGWAAPIVGMLTGGLTQRYIELEAAGIRGRVGG